ncbi:MFS transporter [Phyllobacterium sp. TAF24]|uniref:MFS transporter n=1 Tax=Phyllobacterium sp. TAF24 TaxID=3233068 RepID=UPI003F9D6DC1
MINTQSQHNSHPNWLVGSPTKVQVAAALWMGSIGLLILGLQPILLGAMFTEARLNLDELALVATAELITIGIGSVVFGLALSTRHLKLKSAVMMLLIAGLNQSMFYAHTPHEILGIRAVTGLIEGGAVAVAMELIARSRHAEFVGGLFVTLQTVAQSLLALLFALWVIPHFGSNGGFSALAIVGIASLALAALVPSYYGDLPKQAGSAGGVLSLKAIISLLVIVLLIMGLGAIWAFLEPIGAQNGIDGKTVGVMLSASLAVQVVAALVATSVAQRLNYRAALAGCGLIVIGSAAVLSQKPSLAVCWVAVILLGSIWTFIVPFFVALTLDADPKRDTVLLVPAATLTGAAMGPLAASVFIVDGNVGPVLPFSSSVALGSMVLLMVFILIARRRPVTLRT